MITKFLAAALLASAATLGLATTALANDEPAPGAATGYVYPDFWTSSPTAQRQPRTGAADETSGPSVGLYITRHGRGTYLFPPNSLW